MSFLKSIWKANSKHKKLSDLSALQNSKETENEQVETVENENDVVSFKLKYLGSTLADTTSGENISADAVKSILKVAKAGRKKLQRVAINISIQGISVTDLEGTDVVKASLDRISNSTVDMTHKQVISFISTDEKESLQCHAFLCPKRKTAETVTSVVTQVLSTVEQCTEASEKFEQPSRLDRKENENNNLKRIENNENAIPKISPIKGSLEVKLIDLDDEEPFSEDDTFDFFKAPPEPNGKAHWVCFEDDFVTESPIAPFKSNLILA